MFQKSFRRAEGPSQRSCLSAHQTKADLPRRSHSRNRSCQTLRSASYNCDHVSNIRLLAGPDQARLTVVSTCPATAPARRTVVVRRSPAVFTSAGVSRLRVSLRLDHDGTHMRVRPPGQSADAGALPRWTTGTARVHHPDAHGTPTWHASVGVGRG
jgi:hypothetical protein